VTDPIDTSSKAMSEDSRCTQSIDTLVSSSYKVTSKTLAR
jgi:hypothetical protein